MSFIIKVISFVVIIVTLYVLWIFFFPKFTDDLGNKLWIYSVNEQIRNFKSWADGVSDSMLQLKDAKSNIDYARDVVKQTQDTLQQTQKTITTKIDQTQKVIDSWQKVIDSTKQLKEDVNSLTDFSWTTN